MSVLSEIDKARELVAGHRLSLDDFESLLIGLFMPRMVAFENTIYERVDYQKYIQSDEWKAKAEAAKKAAGYRCQVCNHGKDEGAILDAHHRTYIRLGHERPEDITVLCRDCHGLFETNKKAE